jgi:hypothetical protein
VPGCEIFTFSRLLKKTHLLRYAHPSSLPGCAPWPSPAGKAAKPAHSHVRLISHDFARLAPGMFLNSLDKPLFQQPAGAKYSITTIVLSGKDGLRGIEKTTRKELADESVFKIFRAKGSKRAIPTTGR